MHQLDNPVWHALTGPQAKVAEGSGLARRYRAEYSVFSAMPEEPSDRAWADLAAILGDGGVGVLLPPVVVPAGWETLDGFGIDQMTLPDAGSIELGPTGDIVVTELGPRDRAAMTELTRATEPGPWQAGTADLGTFVGVHVDGRLVAMAGERMRLAGAVEISGVCTDPDHRGRGLAAAVTATMARRILAAGATPFLHVRHDNAGARRVYERIGFRVRTQLRPGVYRAPGGDALGVQDH